MQLFHSKTSPFVRKVMVTAHELGLADRLELLPGAAHPVNRDAAIVARNPLGQVPTLVLDDGTVLADSRVICEYLDDLGGGGVFPPAGPARWKALAAQSTGDGLLDAALLTVYETRVRGEGERSPAWVQGQRAKIEGGLGAIEAAAPGLGDRVDIAAITYGCALGYLDLRFAELGWREPLSGGRGVVRGVRRPAVDAGDPAGLMRLSDDSFRKPHHQPARRRTKPMPASRLRIARQSPRSRRHRFAINRTSYDGIGGGVGATLAEHHPSERSPLRRMVQDRNVRPNHARVTPPGSAETVLRLHGVGIMNGFVALLVAVLVFCAGFLAFGLAVRLALHLDVGPVHLGEGSFLQVALAAAGAAAVWRRTRRAGAAAA